MIKIIVTGCAGFIGSNLIEKLIKRNYEVIGVDNFNDYYDPRIKKRNIEKILKNKNFKLIKVDICNYSVLSKLFKTLNADKVVHLAARAGVRPSIEDPLLYAQVNLQGTLNVLECTRRNNINQIIFASSSSVYGNSLNMPFKEDDLCKDIFSPYGSSKRAAELFIESFVKNYDLNATVLRLFTVYGPKGRPDMSPYLFADALLKNRPINIYGNGLAKRDFTFIDDVTDGIIRSLENVFKFEIINLGNNKPYSILEFIKILEEASGINAKIYFLPNQAGDVKRTWANIKKANKLLNWKPKTSLEKGLVIFFKWLQKN